MTGYRRKVFSLLGRVARLAIAAPWRVLAAAAALAVAIGLFGLPATTVLSAGGFDDPSSESSRADAMLADRFQQGDMKLVVEVSSPGGAFSARADAIGRDVTAKLIQSPHVSDVRSAWSAPREQAGPLLSQDGTTGLIIAGIDGDDNAAQRYTQNLEDELARDYGDVTVRFGGEAAVYAQINRQTELDLVRMESIAIPLSFAAMVWVFGGLLAAAVPVVVGILAILGSLAVLRAIAAVTDVSIFALNLSVALGLALAIDYTLLLLSRFRDERAAGVDRDTALAVTVQTAGRTVVFSAVTVALSMLPMALFPMYFLKSFAYAGVAVVSFAAVAALAVTPAAIVALGPRLDAGRLRRGRRRPPRPGRHRLPDALNTDPGLHDAFWYRSANVVLRHSASITALALVLLVVAGAPILGIKWGSPDDRVLPITAPARQVGDRLRTGFAVDAANNVAVVIPDAGRLSDQQLTDYAVRLSRVPDVISVSAPAGEVVGGSIAGPAVGATGVRDGSAFLTVASTAPLYSKASERQLDSLHGVRPPGDATVLLTGDAQINRDNTRAVTSRLPAVLALIGAVTFVLLFLLSGSLVIPLKSLALNVLSLTAAFGAAVWLFQEGHLGGLGTTATGTMSPAMPVLLFCIAFGISMDYEVFLVARIREYWLISGRSAADNDECVALGLTRTGRVITAAAFIMACSFSALAVADVSFMRMFGVGLTLAILVDATVIRVVLVPALMHLVGRRNWWAPRSLARLHRRIGVTESPVRAPDAYGLHRYE